MLHDLCVAVSTMDGQRVLSKFLKRNYLIIDQGNVPATALTSSSGYFFTKERGLSSSRNDALSLCGSKYLLFADDDVSHINEGLEYIEKEFERTGADIITFMIKTPGGQPFKKYKENSFKHNRRSLFRVNSIEIAVRTSAVKDAGLLFDKRFGLGSQFPTGEEIIFLNDAYNAGLDIRYCPVPIVIHPAESSGSNLWQNDVLIRAKGAMFARVFGYSAYAYCALFSVKHFKKSGYGFIKFFIFLLQGCQLFFRSEKG